MRTLGSCKVGCPLQAITNMLAVMPASLVHSWIMRWFSMGSLLLNTMPSLPRWYYMHVHHSWHCMHTMCAHDAKPPCIMLSSLKLLTALCLLILACSCLKLKHPWHLAPDAHVCRGNGDNGDWVPLV